MMRKFKNSGFMKGVFVTYILGWVLFRVSLWAACRVTDKVTA